MYMFKRSGMELFKLAIEKVNKWTEDLVGSRPIQSLKENLKNIGILFWIISGQKNLSEMALLPL